MPFGATRRGFESHPLRHAQLTDAAVAHTIAAGRARRGTSGALHPQSATAGLNSRSRRLPPVHRRRGPTLRVGSHAAEAREPRQVRKEAAVSERLRVPWGDLAGAGPDGEYEQRSSTPGARPTPSRRPERTASTG